LGSRAVTQSHGHKERAGHSPGIRLPVIGQAAAFRFKSIAVENIGRFKIVRANLQGHAINALLKENEEVPADPTLSFETGTDQCVRKFPPGQSGSLRMDKPYNNKAWFLVIPVFVLVALSAIIPIMTVINYSFQDTFGNNQFFWAGTEWFQDVLRFGPVLGCAGRETCCFSIIILSIEIPLGIAIALTMPKKGIWVPVCLVLMALPLLIPWNVVGTIWQIFGRADIGLLGHTIEQLGFEYNYASNVFDAWVTIILMDVWHWTSLVVLLCYAGLVSIPEAYYQAAKIDGASRWSVFRYIQLPKIRGVLIIAFLLRFMDSFMIYTEPFVLTGGGPGNSTTFMSIDLVKQAIGQFDLGPAAAMSLVYQLIVLTICYVFFTVMSNVGVDKPDARVED
jgi:glycerol transport system permease protein